NADWDSNDLIILVPSPGQTNGGLLVLTGSVKASIAGQITAVRTRLSTCVTATNSVTEPQCAAGARMILGSNIFDVTSRTLATPIPVNAGQFIQVTVVLSFS